MRGIHIAKCYILAIVSQLLFEIKCGFVIEFSCNKSLKFNQKFMNKIVITNKAEKLLTETNDFNKPILSKKFKIYLGAEG
jgi:hypothetical protein